jgi:hypothetical protein
MNEKLTVGGWLFLVCAWSAIVVLNAWCYWQIFRERSEEIVDPLTTEPEA